MVGIKQSGSIPQTPAAGPARKGTWFFFLVVVVDMSTFKHLIGRGASDQVTERTPAEQRHVTGLWATASG